uniref:Uncharacterized protein n=1 Tax=Rangifer tarandus platyrhynchus TaxID=3082113 RepID=A0ACB0FDJ4_RANTA|nr:unnamed protein product [Rangifer tarandus platyrhynchus]
MSKERFLPSPLLLITGLSPGDSRALKKLWTLCLAAHPQCRELGNPLLGRAGEPECAPRVLGGALLPKEGPAEPARLPSPSPTRDCGLGAGSCRELLPPSEDRRLDTQARGQVEGGEGRSGSRILSGAALLALQCPQPGCWAPLVQEIATFIFYDCSRMSI